MTTDSQWRKHSRAHERAFEGLRADTRSHFIYPRSCDVSTRDFDTRPDFPFARAEIGKHLLNSRVGDLSCQKTALRCLALEMGTFRLFQLMQMSKELTRAHRRSLRDKQVKGGRHGQREKYSSVNYVKLLDSIYFAPVITHSPRSSLSTDTMALLSDLNSHCNLHCDFHSQRILNVMKSLYTAAGEILSLSKKVLVLQL